MWFLTVKDAMEKHLPDGELNEDLSIDELYDGDEMHYLMDDMDLKFSRNMQTGNVWITMIFNDEKELAEKVGVILPTEWSTDGLPEVREGWGVFRIALLNKDVPAHVEDYLIDEGNTEFCYNVTIAVSEYEIESVIKQISEFIQ